MKTTYRLLTLFLYVLLAVPATFAQQVSDPSTAAHTQDVTIIIQKEQVRFTSQKAVQMMQLNIFNQAGEPVYDSGPMTVPEINWPLQAANGAALKSGLYAYTLTVQESDASTARTRRGHFIVDRAQDRDGKTDKLWVTSQNDSSIGTELTVARNDSGTVAGTSTTSDRASAHSNTTERETTQREVAGRGETPSTTKTAKATTEAANGTLGQIAKFISGTDLGNSVMTELNGGIGIGVSPQAGYRLQVDGASLISLPNGGAVAFGTPNAETGMAITRGTGRADLRFDGTTVKLLAGVAGGPPDPRNGLVISTSGNVGIGTASPRADFKLHIIGGDKYGIAAYSTTAAGVYGESAQFNGVRGVAYNPNHGAVVGVHSGGGFGVYGESNGAGVVGKSLGGGPGVSGESVQFEGVRGVAHNINHGAVVGVHDGSGFGVYGTSNGTGVVGNSTNAAGYGGYFSNKAGGIALGVEGTARMNALQITGGADFAENFDVNAVSNNVAELKIEAGMVVAIDPVNPGKLTLSTQAYNRRVAGIISGAGGVNPGMRMSQTGTLADGQHPIALSGRVYCWVDASQGAIEPGDFLTTSNTPGHAMKVTDAAKSQGAIIGKAMTGLKAGKGLVLVLVTLQ